MKRRLAREIALQTLFQLEFSDIDKNFARQAACTEREIKEDSNVEYLCSLIDGVLEHRAAIDERIAKSANNWKLERISAVDRNILRVAIYEMLYVAEPMKASIIINEAIEISKIYGTDNSPKFINGILGKMNNENNLNKENNESNEQE